MNVREHEFSSGQACASCKHQRRKCDKNCLLAPYFPAHKYEEFMNAHRLFGVANITKILKSIDPRKRNDAVKSMIVESKARKDHPVEGIVGIIKNLRNQISFYRNELLKINEQISYYEQNRLQIGPSNPIHAPSSSLSSVPSGPSPLLQHYYFDNHFHPQMQVASHDYSLVNSGAMNELKEESNYLQFYPEYFDVKPNIKITDAEKMAQSQQFGIQGQRYHRRT